MLPIIGLLLLAAFFCITYALPDEYLQYLPKSLHSLILVHLKRRSTAPKAPEKKVDTRKFGEWTAEHFTYPNIEPWTEFDVDAVKPLPYRPFRWGPTWVLLSPGQISCYSLTWSL